MDPLTQGLLGATFGQACFGRVLGRRAAVWGAVAGMLPDADIIMNLTGPLAELRWHRGPTHALWFGLLVGPPLAIGVWRVADRQRSRLAAWVGLFVVALFTHPLLDLFTTYGTQLLTPFARTRFALDAVAIIDPAYSILLVAALAVGWRRGFDSVAARRAAIGALVVSTGYLDDLRYGIPGRPRLGLWALRFVFDDQDRPVEPVRRIHRYPSEHPGRGD